MYRLLDSTYLQCTVFLVPGCYNAHGRSTSIFLCNLAVQKLPCITLTTQFREFTENLQRGVYICKNRFCLTPSNSNYIPSAAALGQLNEPKLCATVNLLNHVVFGIMIPRVAVIPHIPRNVELLNRIRLDNKRR